MNIFLFIMSLAFADDVVTLRKGEKAPFDGTLLSPQAAAKIITDSDYTLEKCLIDFLLFTCRIINLFNKVLQIQASKYLFVWICRCGEK